jgi:hypothetical protein
VIGLITENNEAVYMGRLVWYQDNILSLNVSKTKVLVVDYMKRWGEHDGAVVVQSFKFLGVHITKELTWSTHTPTQLRRGHDSASSPSGG